MVAQPADAVRRFGRATFRWKGGDPSIDAPRGQTFVTLEHQGHGDRWERVASDDTFADTTVRSGDDTWTETFQLDECTEPGTYRFTATGRADRGSGPAPYLARSRPFTVTELTLQPATPEVHDGVVTLRVRYPDPGGALLALPRLVRTGTATLRIARADGRSELVTARPDPVTGLFTAAAPGAVSATLVRVHDGCGNTAS